MMNSNLGNTYSIQQVADLTGLSKQVIRKWEERYNIIHPQRLDNGYRIYTTQEILTLKQIQTLIAQGMTVKQAIANLQNDHFVPNPDAQIIFSESPVTPLDGYTKQLINSLLKEGFEGNDGQMMHILQKAHHSLGIKPVIYEIIIPFLYEVGNRWHSGEWEEYKEALASQVIRDFLANLRRTLHVEEHAPLVLGSCLPLERHEIPLHIILLQFMLLGYRSVMLGASPAPKAIEASIEKTKPQIVILSSLTTAGLEDHLKTIYELDDFAENYPKTRFYIGGVGAMEMLTAKPLKNIQLTNNLDDILQDIKGR